MVLQLEVVRQLHPLLLLVASVGKVLVPRYSSLNSIERVYPSLLEEL